jgi:hypothetical protein
MERICAAVLASFCDCAYAISRRSILAGKALTDSLGALQDYLDDLFFFFKKKKKKTYGRQILKSKYAWFILDFNVGNKTVKPSGFTVPLIQA